MYMWLSEIAFKLINSYYFYDVLSEADFIFDIDGQWLSRPEYDVPQGVMYLKFTSNYRVPKKGFRATVEKFQISGK